MVLGGLHLAGSELADRIAPTVEGFASEEISGPDYVVPMHCTGFDAKVALRNRLGEKVVPGGVALVVRVDSEK